MARGARQKKIAKYSTQTTISIREKLMCYALEVITQSGSIFYGTQRHNHTKHCVQEVENNAYTHTLPSSHVHTVAQRERFHCIFFHAPRPAHWIRTEIGATGPITGELRRAERPQAATQLLPAQANAPTSTLRLEDTRNRFDSSKPA